MLMIACRLSSLHSLGLRLTSFRSAESIHKGRFVLSRDIEELLSHQNDISLLKTCTEGGFAKSLAVIQVR